MVTDRRIILVSAALALATIALVTVGLKYDTGRGPDVHSMDNSTRDNPITRIQPDAYYDDPWVYFIGDDYTASPEFGSGRNPTWIDLVASARGWYPRNIGTSGAGYATSAPGGKSYIDQIERAGLADADGIVISGGLHDVNSETPIETIRSRISQAMTRIRSAAPKTPLTVVSVFNPYPEVPSRMDTMNSILEAQAKRVGAIYVYASDLLQGDPSFVGPDKLHATDDGQAKLAQALGPLIAPPKPSSRR